MKNQFIKKVKESVKHWYLLLILGILLIGTGIWTFTSPAESYLALSFVFSISFLVVGILEILFAIGNRKEIDNWGWTLAFGILTALVGLMLLANPDVSMNSLSLYIGFMVMFRSSGSIGLAIDLKNYGVTEWGGLMLIGILGIIFAFILIWNPLFAGMTIVFWTGMALLSNGIFSMYTAFKMRKLHKNI